MTTPIFIKMADITEAGVYRIFDNIKNFLLRVRLRRLHVTKQSTKEAVLSDDQFIDIRWQEKYFSLHEEGVYANETNCVTATHKNYHQLIVKMREHDGRPNDRLFTYTNSDYNNGDVTMQSTEKNSLIINGTVDATKGLRQYYQTDTTDQYVISKRRNTKKLSSNDGIETMFVMADLHSAADEVDEHILCQLLITSEGVLTITPSVLQDDDAWYRIENKHNEVYEYQLLNISEFIDEDSKLSQNHLTIKTLQLAAPPCSSTTWLADSENVSSELLVFGSVVSATGFESDNLYICIGVVPNKDWMCDEPAIMTQICACNEERVAYFSFPLEYSFVCGNNVVTSRPSLLLQVCSIDTWERHRTVGYGTMPLPFQPGFNSLNVGTWKPKPKYLIEKLRDYFIGGGPELNDSSTYVMRDYNKSRYGFETESSGTIQLYISTVFQNSNNSNN